MRSPSSAPESRHEPAADRPRLREPDVDLDDPVADELAALSRLDEARRRRHDSSPSGRGVHVPSTRDPTRGQRSWAPAEGRAIVGQPGGRLGLGGQRADGHPLGLPRGRAEPDPPDVLAGGAAVQHDPVVDQVGADDGEMAGAFDEPGVVPKSGPSRPRRSR